MSITNDKNRFISIIYQSCSLFVHHQSIVITKDISPKTRDVIYTFMTYQLFTKGCHLTLYNPSNWYVIIKRNKNVSVLKLVNTLCRI